MRDILFRGFQPYENGKRAIVVNGEKIKGDWFYGDINFVPSDSRTYIRANWTNIEESSDGCFGSSNNMVKVLPETVGQFTGLTDKNGNKIFEGDIVQVPSNLAGTEFYIGTIEFGNFDNYNDSIYTGFFIKWHNVSRYSTLRQSIIWWRDEKDRFLKVIGNIYDNPELLKKD